MTSRNRIATRDQAKYPSLWSGCVGAWAPCLGPTGLTLRDWSGRGNHGEFQNLTASAGWGIVGGEVAVQFANTTNRVVASSIVLSGSGDFTIAGWVWLPASGSQEKWIQGNFSVANMNGVELYIYTTSKLHLYLGSALVSTSSVPALTWTHCAAIRRNGTVTLYINGIADGSGSRTTSITTSTQWSLGNAAGYSTGGAITIGSQIACSVAITERQLQSLVMRQRVMYEMAPRRRSSVQVAGFNTAWIRRRSLVIGGGIN